MSNNPWLDELDARKGQAAPARKTPLPRLSDLKRIIKKTPEVLFKISRSSETGKDKNGRASSKTIFPSPRNQNSLKGAVQYISRDGETEMIDENGLIYSGKHAVEDAIEGWNMPAESDKRQALHIMMGMPQTTACGSLTDVANVFEATDSTVAKLFKNHMYLIAHHEDSENGHPHSHVIVKIENNYGKRLDPRKADLKRYRESYAHELRERGIDANATSKIARLSTRRSLTKGNYRHLADDQTRLNKRLQHGITDAHIAQLSDYLNAASAMKNSADKEKRELSDGLTQHVSRATGIPVDQVEREVEMQAELQQPPSQKP